MGFPCERLHLFLSKPAGAGCLRYTPADGKHFVKALKARVYTARGNTPDQLLGIFMKISPC